MRHSNSGCQSEGEHTDQLTNRSPPSRPHKIFIHFYFESKWNSKAVIDVVNKFQI